MNLDQASMAQCRGADLMACVPEELVDLKDVRIDTSLPVRDRMAGFLEQVRNPYLFKAEGLIIKATYPPETQRRLRDALPDLLAP